VVGLNEDIILCTIRKSRLLVVSGTPILPILLYAAELNVVPLLLVEHDHALGTLDACARVVLAKDWGLSWRESACGGLDVGDLAVVADHKFVGLAAMVGDPETGADTPTWRALWHICGDGIGGHSAERSVIFSRENDEILEGDLAEVALVGDGKGVARCIRFILCVEVRRGNAMTVITTETLRVIPPIPKGFCEFSTMREGR